MPRRVVLLVMAFLSIAAPVAAQSTTREATVRPPPRFTFTPITFAPDRIERSRFIRGASPWTRNATVTRVPHKRSKAPIVGGMLLGSIAGFLGGNYVQRSVCEYDCGPGGFTWGFTAAGAAAGAAIGWLFR